jgi:uncharacterized protein (DUF433 family)
MSALALEHDIRGTRALYTVADTAVFLGQSYETVRGWMEDDLITALPSRGKAATIPFFGLAEAFVLAECKRRNMTRREIREGVRAIKKELNLDFALANRMVYTMVGSLAIKGSIGFHRARDSQLMIFEIAADHAELVEFDPADYAIRITLPAFNVPVTVNPYVAAGAPVLGSSRIKVQHIVDRARALEPIRDIAEDFDLTEDTVRNLVAVEKTRDRT